MYFTTNLVLVLACSAWAMPQQSQQPQQQQQIQNGQSTTPIPIVSQSETMDGNGSFSYSYETGNGIRISQQGFIKQVPQLASRSGPGSDQEQSDGNVQVQQGSYSYTAPDGTVISVNYTADESGFHPQGDHLPTPPPVPEHVVNLLNQIAQNPQQPQPAQSNQDFVAVQNPQYFQQQQQPQQFQQALNEEEPNTGFLINYPN